MIQGQLQRVGLTTVNTGVGPKVRPQAQIVLLTALAVGGTGAGDCAPLAVGGVVDLLVGLLVDVEIIDGR